MAENKTRATDAAPADFIAAVEPANKRQDAVDLDAIFRRVTGAVPMMWGPTIIGYGSYHYRYASGREGRAPRVGFSPRKAKHSLYLMDCENGGGDPMVTSLLDRLGKHTRGVSCLYVNRLSDIDMDVLEELAALSWKRSKQDWPDD